MEQQNWKPTKLDCVADVVSSVAIICASIVLIVGVLGVVASLLYYAAIGNTPDFFGNRRDQQEDRFYAMCAKQGFSHEQCVFFHCGTEGCKNGERR